MVNQNTALVVKGLGFKYHHQTQKAIQNISFEAQEGEIVVVAGPSGSGKTTLQRCINGLIPHSYHGEYSGQVFVKGQEIYGLPLRLISQKVGTVLQDPEKQIVGSTVFSEIAFGLENLGRPREEILERAEAVMDRLGILGLKNRDTFSLSGGEKQKVALAGVLVMDSQVLLMDEPLANLDPQSGFEILTILRGLADQGMTILLIEHRLEDVLKIHPNRMLYLQNGETRYLGDVKGFEDQADYHEVRLPASVIMRAVRREGVSERKITRQKSQPVSGPELLRYEQVQFSYNRSTNTLDGINLSVHQGDIIAVLGPNGAGKSTLLKLAIGLLKPTAGQVVVNGNDTRQSSVAQIAQNLGYVFQNPGQMLFASTVHEELAFGPKNLGHAAAEIPGQVTQALEAVNMKEFEQSSPFLLSFGQQKRITIASVLAMQSEILAMDEPTAGQDYRNYRKFMESILGLKHFKAFLYITHDLDLALTYANRIWLIYDGQIVADGRPEEVLADTERLRRCRILPTSLLETNLNLVAKTGRFMDAETLAFWN